MKREVAIRILKFVVQVLTAFLAGFGGSQL